MQRRQFFGARGPAAARGLMWDVDTDEK